MKRILLLAALWCAVFSTAQAAEPVTSSSTSIPITLTPVANEAFRVGEKFAFDIKYQFIKAGKATLEITRGLVVQGRPTLNFISEARSTKFIDNFFIVRDYNASQVDALSLASVNFHQNLREGHYRVVRNTAIDYRQGKYFFDKLRKGKLTKRSGLVAEPMSDMLSAFFYARTLPLEPGKNYFLSVFSDGASYSMKVAVGSKIERVKVDAGEFQCLRVQPQVDGDSIFRASDGKMTIWMTNDKNKIPVLIRSKVAVGSFDAELDHYQLGPVP